MNVPFVDLKSQYLNIKKEIDLAISKVIDDTAFIRGKYVDQFEKNLASLYGINHCIGVASGTDAIYIILKMLNLGVGDEVITTAHTWISTSETITQAGAKPVFVDIEPEYYTIDPGKIIKKITPKTKAIIVVHIYGQMADMDPLQKICQEFDLFLIEDCAQSHLSQYKDKVAGKFGIAGSLSFYPGKNLGAYGDAGAIITDDQKLATNCRRFANHGAISKHDHQFEGINSRLDGLQASILDAKLKYLHDWNKKRILAAQKYNQLLSGLPQVEVPKIRPNSTHTFHLYVIQCEERDKLSDFLTENKIQTGIHYPTPLPFLPAYYYLNHKKTDFPNTDKIYKRILSLPLYPEIRVEQIEYVSHKIKEFYSR
jgi:dTDP-4-amino-4,6-dideoxygalactose transaminase